jgi:hypothetical protein
MLYCPDDLEPCRREGCGAGQCRRTAEPPLTTCLECGVVVTRHLVVAVCIECAARYAPHAQQET